MPNANSYAHALLELAEQEQVADDIYAQVEQLLHALQQLPEAKRFFAAPNLKREERERGIDAVLASSHQLLRNTVKLQCAKGDGGQLAEMLAAYRSAYQQARGILPVQLISAYPLDVQQQERLRAGLAEMTGKHILLETKLDASIIGGIRVVMDGKSYDSTLRSRLAEMKRLLHEELSLD